MPKWTSQRIRDAFIDYFTQHGHTRVSSSPLIPAKDPTLLFTNAGMVQFKNVFLGHEKRPYLQATSIQRCVRAGGKHNDLENVGYTRRHHTFFEMLGNFSFGAYFKREAIFFAWEFLTKVVAIPAEKLWVTVYKEDPESEAIWLKEVKIDSNRFSRCTEKDNFWSMGETGPCGPCTEIFYDHGEKISGGPPGTAEEDGDRYVEIWNLVFMQFNRDVSGALTSLPKPCVDTGMGLERVAAVLQGVHDNYDIDTFQHLLRALSALVGIMDFSNTSMRVIVDHIRSVAFLISDGVTPSNEGRGYVLRRIIRRAIRHGYQLGCKQPFFHKLVPALVDIMKEAYPELRRSQQVIQEILEQEEKQFSNTLENGLKILDEEIGNLTGNIIPGKLVFQLYDTYGFPPDLTADIARERKLSIDIEGFETAMAEQRERSQQRQHFAYDHGADILVESETEFTGYQVTEETSSIVALLKNNQSVLTLKAGEQGIVILDRTPFYAEGGGQVGDCGVLKVGSTEFIVQDTKKKGKTYLHFGEVTQGQLNLNDWVVSTVGSARLDTMRNHSATHLLHAALRRVLGKHVQQKGSLVSPDRLRFDFSHPKAVTEDELQEVEHLVNQQIRGNYLVELSVSGLDEAREKGAIAFFDEKYGEQVRVITLGDFSKEVCGGTHVGRAGDIGLFKIVSECAIASGVRRIEAVTGEKAIRWIFNIDYKIKQLSDILKSKPEKMVERLQALLEQNKILQREILQLRQKIASQQVDELMAQVKIVQDINVIAVNLAVVDRDTLRKTLDQLKEKLGKCVILLASSGEQVQLIAGVSQDLTHQIKASELMQFVAEQVGGKGGGRANLAQGAGTQPAQLREALASVLPWVESKLK